MSDEQRTPQWSDATLLAYLDGELEAELAQKIERSPQGRRRLRRLAREQRQLASSLHRATCPGSHRLGEYHLQLLAPEQASAIAQHLQICSHCQQELEELQGFLEELAPEIEYSLQERVQILIARLLPQAPRGASLGEALPAAVRGAGDGPRIYEADDVQVTLDVQEDPARAGRKSILGIVTGVDAKGWDVQVWHDEEQVSVEKVDDAGNFVVEALAPGSYRLLLRGADVAIYVEELAVS
jgi:anti-sigma factor RsiW